MGISRERMVVDDESALVTRAARGDRAAFGSLVRRTSRLVYARIYLETGNRHQAEDLTQDVFLKAFRSIRQLDEPGHFRQWLITIAERATVDDIRRRSRKKRGGAIAGMSDVNLLPADGDGPAGCAQQREAQQRALAVLRNLPAEYRLPVTMRYVGGADYATIAQQLGITTGALRGLLQRGIALMRRHMQLPGQQDE